MNILITGTSSGIGEAIALELLPRLYRMYGDVNAVGVYVGEPSFNLDESLINQIHCNVGDWKQVQEILPDADWDVLINCAGVNYINWIEDTPEEEWDRLMNTNAKAIFLLAKKYIPGLIRRKGTILNIVSNAAHTPMTHSIAYNASKGASHIMTLQMARELGPKGVTVFGLAPNKTSDTKMSEYIDNRVCELRGWTHDYAREYQLKSLSSGMESDRWKMAQLIAYLLEEKENHKYMAGTIIPYGR